jgi:hypothetical protein
MNHRIKKYFLFLFLFSPCFVFSQTDSTNLRGTIKIVKVKDAEVYVKAICSFNKYSFAQGKGTVESADTFQPFPIVEGYTSPFQYNRYINSCFSKKAIDLKGKSKDTVVLELKILANGKVYISDKSPTMILKGVPATYDPQTGSYELNNLHLNSLKCMKQINKWVPGYVLLPKKDTFRGEVVIKPIKKNVDVIGTLVVLFSTTPFEG